MELEIDGTLKKLIGKHPRLFHGRAPRVHSWVEPGWYAVLDALCTDLEALLAATKAVALEVLQIKEKLGGLRFYFALQATSSVPSEQEEARLEELHGEVSARVAQAEQAAGQTCAACGMPGKLRKGTGDLATLCDSHAAAPDAHGAEVAKGFSGPY